MSTEIRERLIALPPTLPDRPDRFEVVRHRVRRRRRRQVAGASLVAVVAVGIGAPVVVASLDDGGAARDGGGIATQSPTTPEVPATPVPTTPVPTAEQTTTSGEPGDDEQVALAEIVTTDGTGSATVDLGDRPAEATGVSVDVICTGAGTIRFTGYGTSNSCPGAEPERAGRLDRFNVLALDSGQDTIEITARAGVTWRVATTYVQTVFTPAPTNANGQTYGNQNEHGTPDLIGVIASNRASGYVYADAYNNPPVGVSRIPVYLSDGLTQVGTFKIG